MELIKNKSFGGERPLFGAHDVRLPILIGSTALQTAG